eukprot:TRINITY_DN2623_c0_g1_i1.p1 TRINITY_DN2623_c0_g1~~TRINITY_DN2623_c0_g1_i1.p1  ORF type:complete len:497 (-),score=162.01 TRINITY_DN2623_c0_g1_i1:184-1674(-)
MEDTEEDRLFEAEELKKEGNQRYQEGDFEEAVEFYTGAIELLQNVAYYGNRAAAYLQLGKPKLALADCEIALGMDPSFVKCHLRAAKCHFQMGNLVQARMKYEEVTKLEPHNHSAKEELVLLEQIYKEYEIAKEQLELENFHMALKHLEQIFVYCPQSDDILVMKARAFLGMGMEDTAQRLASDVMKGDPNNVGALFIKGRALSLGGNLTGAVNYYKTILTMDPDNRPARDEWKKIKTLESLKEQGNEAFKISKFQEAFDLYSQALTVDFRFKQINSTLYCNRAAAAMKINRWEQAASDCTKAIELDENYLKAYTRRASIYMTLERYEDAVRDYEKAHQMDQDNHEIKQNLKQAKLELKKSQRKDYYKVLGVPKTAGEEEIKKAYKHMARLLHPDKNGGSPEAEKKFKDLQEAYGVLSDQTKKYRYDNGQDPEGNGMGMEQDVDMNNLFNMMFTQGGGFGGSHGGFGGGMHGGFGGGRHGGGRRGNPFGPGGMYFN